MDERIASLSAQLSKLAADLVATEIELKVLRAETIARENPGQALRAWTEILKQCIKSKHWRVDHALEEIERILPRVLASGGLGSMEEGQLALTLQLLPERYETRKMRLQTQLRSDPGDAAR
ncbi:MAG: hypothetical protein A49_11670 [Methyloceanibacter sp.]|nr:MAG: hypothetical protein A49_11670 [Methyloceanibacter sp.]